MKTILKAEALHKSYPMGRETLPVLNGVNLSIAEGSLAAIVGASGSGKSTLLHLLGALDRPDSGSIEFRGKPLSGFSLSQLNTFRNRSIGFVFQFYHLLDEMNVLENTLLPVMVGAGTLQYTQQKAQFHQRARNLLDQFGLGRRLNHKPYELSGGERQRVAIARALINKPDLLLADEPTGNLDSQTGSGILEVLKELNQDGQTIVMVTHDDRIAAQAGQLLRLEDGKMN